MFLLGIPPDASGHGSEYLFAKLKLSENPRRVELELSLEYLENTLIETVEEARKALSSHVLIESGAGSFPLCDIPQRVTWSERDTFDESAPAPVAGSEDGVNHRLLVARADLSGLEAESLNLRISEEGEQAVIFWVDEPVPEILPDSESPPMRWVILIAGDRSMAVELPPKPSSNWKRIAWISASLGLGVLALGIAVQSKRQT